VFFQNTPLLSDAVPRVGTLGWYALPRWGKWNDGVSDPAFMPSHKSPITLSFIHLPYFCEIVIPALRFNCAEAVQP
jgi:hypothetical protein